jgi:hypothetical protein
MESDDRRRTPEGNILRQLFAIVAGGMILGWIAWSSTTHIINETRLAKLETHIPYISQTVMEIKNMIQTHLDQDKDLPVNHHRDK